ncbi:MAG TPA: glycosyltransferase [Anaerolinea thermolimosa]|uniref:Glycosyltransferase n=1 Tax=Anaerolinea thermolimosa TaxID=229919 RepID=A0A3D1JGY6_9CHLR|nr:glycosyltransferase [Anaerolinea thermolimosa]
MTRSMMILRYTWRKSEVLVSSPLSEPTRLHEVPLVGIVVPVYNEEEALPAFHRLLCEQIDGLPYRFRIYYVNDGSTDGTAERLKEIQQADRRVCTLELSRNFGHQAALSAGLDAAEGDYVISLDGDGQHPPALIPEMLRLAEAGYEVVLTQRADTEDESGFKRWTSAQFYRLINRIGETRVLPGGADFRLLARPALDALRGMREYHRFLRGMVSWIGFRTVILPYQPPQRIAGKSKYTLKKMLRLARDAIFSFSLVPLYIGLSMGGLMLFLALVEMVYVLSLWFSGQRAQLEPGWSSLMFVILVVSGILMILLGFIGIYIGYIFQEVKRRPVYIIRKAVPAREDTAEA